MDKKWICPSIEKLEIKKTMKAPFDGHPCNGTGPNGNSETCPVYTQMTKDEIPEIKCPHVIDGNKPGHDSGVWICNIKWLDKDPCISN